MQAKRYVLVSFATSKGAGSERGVGWAFVCAAVELATTTSPETHIHIILDDRDRDNVEANLPVALPVNLHLHYVGMPRILARIPGEAKTRLSYLFWLFPAQKIVKSIVALRGVRVIHQVTFASFVMPSIIRTFWRPSRDIRTLWGPANISMGEIPRWPSSHRKLPNLKRYLKVLIRTWARFQARSVDVALANNHHTQAFIGLKSTVIEPNIFLEKTIFAELSKQSVIWNQVSLVGNLNRGKQPWYAIELLTRKEAAHLVLKIVGDGPLRLQLADYAEKLGVSNRVSFIGKVSHRESLQVIAESAVLLHPSCSEGSPWVVGEATAIGTPCVVLDNSGSETTLRLATPLGEIVSGSGDVPTALANAVSRILSDKRREPSRRWDFSRGADLLKKWWEIE